MTNSGTTAKAARSQGWGGRIRTCDHGTKTRCLTTWPRPNERGQSSLGARHGRRPLPPRAALPVRAVPHRLGRQRVSQPAPAGRPEGAGGTAELAGGRRFLDGLATRPAALHLLGPPGIGKTALWQELRDDAVARGMLVLSARPVESETQLGF